MATLWPLVVAGLLLLAGSATASADELACNQTPGDRFYWIERAFCDLEMAGPQRAQGVIIWNHGIFGTTESWKAPAPPVLRLAQARGWDVIMLKRHHLAETMPGGPLDRTVKRTLEEVAARRQAGYKKVALAGQSFGGYVTMESIDVSSDIDAAIAFAPGVRSAAASGALDPAVIERILQRVRVGRLAVVFPKDDTLFGSIARGERARPILAKRDFAWLMVDEAADEIRGHGGAVTGRFALRYGPCLSESSQRLRSPRAASNVDPVEMMAASSESCCCHPERADQTSRSIPRACRRRCADSSVHDGRWSAIPSPWSARFRIRGS